MKRLAYIGVCTTLAWTAGCEPSSEATTVARAGDYELTVAEAVELLAPRSTLPNEPGLVRSLAELWVDYTLLADATLRDSSYADIEVDEWVDQQVEGRMVFDLRDSVVRADTAVTDDELLELFAQESPGFRVRARHILLGYPEQSTQAQRDSVRARLAALLEQIRAGADFAELARTYSQDRGSGGQGGDLGFFGPGEMVEPLEEAAFALGEGEVSGIVETPYGLHLVKVEERIVPGFDEVRDAFRQEVQNRRMARAESAYVAGMREAADPSVVEDAGTLVREMARNPALRLSPRAADRAVVTWEGGELTVGELRSFMLTRAPAYRAQVVDASDQALEDNILLPLAHRELTVRAAREAGLDPSPEVRDSLAAAARTAISSTAEALGLRDLEIPGDVTREEAVENLVDQILQQILDEEGEAVPLGPVGFALRNSYRVDISSTAPAAVVRRIEEIRGAGPRPQTPAPAAGAQDSGGGNGP